MPEDEEKEGSPKEEGDADEKEEEDLRAQEEAQEEMARLMASVKDMAIYNISMIASQAWHHLGLVPIPGTGEAKLDLDQARMAIDLYEANLEILSPHLEQEARKQLRQGLTDLQLNYVNKSNKE